MNAYGKNKRFFMFKQWYTDNFLAYGKEILISLIIILIWIAVARYIRSSLLKICKNKSVDMTAAAFLVNATYWLLLILLIIVILAYNGVPTTSLITILGASGLAIGLALKDSLSNIASGLLLISLRPFRIGDFIETVNSAGTVTAINLFTTQLKTPNNERIHIPNSKIMSDKVVNKAINNMRRLDLEITIDYDSDIKKAKQLITALYEKDSRILLDPPAAVLVKALADSAVVLAVRPWVNKDDYANVMFDLLENIKLTFDENDIIIPFPQITMGKRDPS